jgi:putative ABC transport system ATP-binding protein
MMKCKKSIEISELTITFSRWGQTINAIDGLSINIFTGDWVMIVGHNGSGKSTLLKAISGRIKLDSGKLNLDGVGIEKLSSAQIAERVFLVHQDPLQGTSPTLSVFDNLFIADAAVKRTALSRSGLFDKYHDLLKPLGLSDRLKQLAKYLSGGERQLLALTIASLRPSQTILLDEPLAALDPSKAEICLSLIKTLNKEGKTVIQVTHDPNLAITEGTRTVALRKGQVIYEAVGSKRKVDALRKLWLQEIDV